MSPTNDATHVVLSAVTPIAASLTAKRQDKSGLIRSPSQLICRRFSVVRNTGSPPESDVSEKVTGHHMNIPWSVIRPNGFTDCRPVVEYPPVRVAVSAAFESDF